VHDNEAVAEKFQLLYGLLETRMFESAAIGFWIIR